MLLQKARSGPLGSNVLLRDVGITSEICGSHGPSGDVQKCLHGNNLENGLRDEQNNCHDMLMKSHAKKKCCPSGVFGEIELHDGRFH